MTEGARLAVLVSGNGTNLQAIIDAVQEQLLPAQIALVVSNRREAYGLERAALAGIPTLYFPLQTYRASAHTRQDYDEALASRVAACEPALVVLAGWMHVLSSAFLERFAGGVLNLHPALPGQFPGTHAIERALEAYRQGKITYTGVMVHWVVPDVDAGPVVATIEVPIEPTDTLDDLETRMHAAEHALLIRTIRQVLVNEREHDG